MRNPIFVIEGEIEILSDDVIKYADENGLDAVDGLAMCLEGIAENLDYGNFRFCRIDTENFKDEGNVYVVPTRCYHKHSKKISAETIDGLIEVAKKWCDEHDKGVLFDSNLVKLTDTFVMEKEKFDDFAKGTPIKVKFERDENLQKKYARQEYER